jgi:hypothetical protein
VNTVGDEKESEAVLTAAQTSKAALEPSKSPAPTPSPKETAPVLPDSAASSSWISCYGYVPTVNVSNLVLYWALNAVAYAVAVTVVYGLLYRFASVKFPPKHELTAIEEKYIPGDYQYCFPAFDCYFDDYGDWIDEIPVRVETLFPNLVRPIDYYYYKPNPSKLKLLLRPLKTWLRKKFKMPVNYSDSNRIKLRALGFPI